MADVTEQAGQVPAGMRTTTRLRTALAVAVEDGRDQSEVAAAHRVSWPTVQRAVVVHGTVKLAEPEPIRCWAWTRPARSRTGERTRRPPGHETILIFLADRLLRVIGFVYRPWSYGERHPTAITTP
jgi:hypothetical protein